METVFIATSNQGKLRDFAAAAKIHGIEVLPLPEFGDLPEVLEDGNTFEENARKKAEFYSAHAPGKLVLADDSGLEVDALNRMPGVRSARYGQSMYAFAAPGNSPDDLNNAKLLRELKYFPEEERAARFVCVIAAAWQGSTLATFRGEADGTILHEPRGNGGFGYDPLFFIPRLGRTYAELNAEEKAAISHRGKAFEKFLAWLGDSRGR